MGERRRCVAEVERRGCVAEVQERMYCRGPGDDVLHRSRRGCVAEVQERMCCRGPGEARAWECGCGVGKEKGAALPISSPSCGRGSANEQLMLDKPCGGGHGSSTCAVLSYEREEGGGDGKWIQ
eukprot:222955-Chlamydomonas_euryale.AAC.1